MKTYNELQLAKELMRFPSITPIDAGTMNFLAKKLRSLGFKCKILEFKSKNSKPVKNLYARLGKGGPNFCYAGHTDVVPPGNLNDWTVNPFKPAVKGNYLIGRGANDMKASIACFVSAVSKFKDKKFKAQMIKNIPLGRVAQESDVSTAVAFLAADSSNSITGTSLMVDGGWTAQ